jgi:Rieske [2Fe-2S] domain
VREVAGESVLIVRTRAGRPAAHYNVCPHRGPRLVPACPRGNFRGGIRCPYHSWTYTLEGALRTAPFLTEGDGLSKADFSLHPVCKLVPAFKQGGGSDLDWEQGIPHREGAWTFTATGTTNRSPFEGLDEEERIRHKGELGYPNLLLSLSAEHVAAFVLFPPGTDPHHHRQ